jgi:quercetin dioxygenase-like cupin family protein
MGYDLICKVKNRRCAMRTVKQLLFVALIGAFMVSAVTAHEEEGKTTSAPGPTTEYKAKFPVTLKAGEYDLQTVIMDFPPGAVVQKHTHGGYLLVTVLHGEVTLKKKDSERIIKAGESWTESPGDQHTVVNAGTAAARILINMLLPKGAEATTIIK